MNDSFSAATSIGSLRAFPVNQLPGSNGMTMSLADSIYSRLETLLGDAERQTKPLELEPFRGQIFEVFARAYHAGLTALDSDPDLSADGVCRELALRWGLTMAARDAVAQQTKLPSEQLAKMRLLWSLLRMWMEWTYAWDRRDEAIRND